MPAIVTHIMKAEVMGSRAAWALGEWPALEEFVRGEHMQSRRHVIEEGSGVESCLVLEAVVATQKGRLDEVLLLFLCLGPRLIVFDPTERRVRLQRL